MADSDIQLENTMNKAFSFILAATVLVLAGCATLHEPTKSHKAAIESVLAQRAKLEKEHVNVLSAERIAGLMAIDVNGCPPAFRSAWFDYLVAAQTLHTRIERVAGVAAAVGKPVSDLRSLVEFAATKREVGQYLLDGLGKVDDGWAKVERAGMNYGAMPEGGLLEPKATAR